MKFPKNLAILAIIISVMVACQTQSPAIPPKIPGQQHLSPDNLEVPIESVASKTLSMPGSPDWLEIGFNSVWISDGAGIRRLDVKTNKILATYDIKAPCGAMAIGFDSVWVESCALFDQKLVRIDPRSNQVIATIPVSIADSEGSIAAGEGSIWILSESGTLSRINPKTNQVIANISVYPSSYAVMTGYGAVWVTNNLGPNADSLEIGTVQRIDPKTNQVVKTIQVHGQPRFLCVGENGVWVLNQGDGSVSHIDPKTNRVVDTIDAGAGLGGDIACGEGAVWVRSTSTLLTVIDSATGQIIRRYGPSQGSSGSVRARDGMVWVSAEPITDENIGTVWELTSDD